MRGAMKFHGLIRMLVLLGGIAIAQA